ncbi:B-box domain protein 31-like [Sesamum indicum]|uniref:B-box domain protein 31-like n=1 Tax=Sesamum indicum TaxID=4182 RepID=A0A6I9UM39_SESIN|nr:B-box domain protein 31-like [Sesamum indicum]
MMRACELCKGVARMHCESDQASLCWDCDAKVHSANFLVARHSRNLLCHVCQSPTRWAASGSKLGPTVSVCQRCVRHDEPGEEDEEEAPEEEEADEEELEENQVVPWPSPSPPPSEESYSSGDEPVGGGVVAVSRELCRLETASANHPCDV